MAHARSLEYEIRDAGIRLIDWRNLSRIDWMLCAVVACLATAGFFALYSACRTTEMGILYRQLGGFGVGIVVAAGLACLDYRFLVSLGPIFYSIALVLLIGVELNGHEAGGSERWLQLGPIRIQPSELSKLAMIVGLAWYFTMLGPRIRKLHWFLLTFALVGAPTLLILKQPNLGTAATMGPITLAMLYAAGCRKWHLAAVILAGFSLFPVLWLEMQGFHPENKPYGTVTENQEVKVNPESKLGLKDYQKKRIYAFLHPEYDPKGSGWHTTQSRITIGSGGLSGKGYLQGTQTRLNYLPEHTTDFIFSVVAEEWGFIGVAVCIGLFAAFLFRGLIFARDCPEMQGTLLATGIITALAFHIFVNIAVTVGLMPVTGIPLPFLSYGRSFYLTVMACVGVLLSIPARQHVRYVNR
jgi:rod shape determining protein RodA